MGKKKKESRKHRKKKDHDESDSSVDEELERRVRKELKKLKKKEKKKRKEKKALKRLVKEKLSGKIVKKEVGKNPEGSSAESYDINVSLMTKPIALTPMTKEEWDKQQSVLHRVYDEESGRTRLMRASGEIMEEIVSRDKHIAINKRATQGDGEYFQRVVAKQHN